MNYEFFHPAHKNWQWHRHSCFQMILSWASCSFLTGICWSGLCWIFDKGPFADCQCSPSSSVLFVTHFINSVLISLDSNLHLFNSGSYLGFTLVLLPYTMAWKLSQVNTLGQQLVSSLMFLSFKNNCHSLPDSQCLENHRFMYFVCFGFVFIFMCVFCFGCYRWKGKSSPYNSILAIQLFLSRGSKEESQNNPSSTFFLQYLSWEWEIWLGHFYIYL